MSFGGIIWRAMAKATTYRGRDSRSQFWLFTFAFWLLIAAYLATAVAIDGNDDGALAIVIVLVFGVLMVWALMAHVASVVRRLHDTDKSGGWALLLWIPYVAVVVYVLSALRGSSGENRFGHDPKLIAEEVARRRAVQVT